MCSSDLYANESPDLQFADISKKVAEDWRLCDESVRKDYEEKAQRYNAEEEKRWRQKLYMHQQQQMQLQVNQSRPMAQKDFLECEDIRGLKFLLLQKYNCC